MGSAAVLRSTDRAVIAEIQVAVGAGDAVLAAGARHIAGIRGLRKCRERQGKEGKETEWSGHCEHPCK